LLKEVVGILRFPELYTLFFTSNRYKKTKKIQIITSISLCNFFSFRGRSDNSAMDNGKGKEIKSSGKGTLVKKEGNREGVESESKERMPHRTT